jgi:hypothetical protein
MQDVFDDNAREAEKTRVVVSEAQILEYGLRLKKPKSQA